MKRLTGIDELGYYMPCDITTPMQTAKERLTHILLKMPVLSGCEDEAAYLLANGVTFKEE